MKIERMCSVHGDRRGPPKGAGHKDGGMSRSPYHIVEMGEARALCGRDASEYLTIDECDIKEAAEHSDCCKRCAKIADPFAHVDMRRTA
ncbi:MAG: hypothetical protein JJ902_04185 [Roseibium sp.]|nr:hypothetical protein [Roseibium sp.]